MSGSGGISRLILFIKICPDGVENDRRAAQVDSEVRSGGSDRSKKSSLAPTAMVSTSFEKVSYFECPARDTGTESGVPEIEQFVRSNGNPVIQNEIMALSKIDLGKGVRNEARSLNPEKRKEF